MKTLMTTAIAALFATSVHAADDSLVYHGWEDGNPDLQTSLSEQSAVTASRSSVGDIDRYRGWADGNPDLFSPIDGGNRSSGPVDVYRGFADGNPDLI